MITGRSSKIIPSGISLTTFLNIQIWRYQKMVKGIGERKVKFAAEISCPHCGFMISIETGKIIKKPSQPAEYEEYTDVKKSDQSKVASGSEEDEDKEEDEKID